MYTGHVLFDKSAVAHAHAKKTPVEFDTIHVDNFFLYSNPFT